MTPTPLTVTLASWRRSCAPSTPLHNGAANSNYLELRNTVNTANGAVYRGKAAPYSGTGIFTARLRSGRQQPAGRVIMLLARVLPKHDGDVPPPIDLPQPDLPARDEAEEQYQRRILVRQRALRLHATAKFLVQSLRRIRDPNFHTTGDTTDDGRRQESVRVVLRGPLRYPLSRTRRLRRPRQRFECYFVVFVVESVALFELRAERPAISEPSSLTRTRCFLPFVSVTSAM
jgi:hypothetical protein